MNILNFHIMPYNFLNDLDCNFSCLTFTFSFLNQQFVNCEQMSLRGFSLIKMSAPVGFVSIFVQVQWGPHPVFLLRNDRDTVCQRLRCACGLRCSYMQEPRLRSEVGGGVFFWVHPVSDWLCMLPRGQSELPIGPKVMLWWVVISRKKNPSEWFGAMAQFGAWRFLCPLWASVAQRAQAAALLGTAQGSAPALWAGRSMWWLKPTTVGSHIRLCREGLRPAKQNFKPALCGWRGCQSLSALVLRRAIPQRVLGRHPQAESRTARRGIGTWPS
jgi:hypothetical protein